MHHDTPTVQQEGREPQHSGETNSSQNQPGESAGGSEGKTTRRCDLPHAGNAKLVGKRFGKWVLKGFSHRIKKHHYWGVLCACGFSGIRLLKSITQGRSYSCGCERHRKRIDLTGTRVGRLSVISFFGKKPNKTAHFWNCVCDCGQARIVNQQNLVEETSKSCGCLGLETRIKSITKHGHSRGHGANGRYSPEYRTWMSMKSRCQNPNNKRYMDYGGRGIEVCERWESFIAFFQDMGNRPEGLCIERENNALGYFKENCKWATPREQQNNSRKNVRLTHAGITMTLAQWSQKIGVKPHTLQCRISRGWSVDRALREKLHVLPCQQNDGNT